MTELTTAEKLRQRKRVVGPTLTQFSMPWIAPILRKRNIDYVLVELEHHAFDWRELEAFLRSCNDVDLTAIVRVTDIAYEQISKVLDLGADGVLIPRLESLAQLQRVIEIVRLPPRGKKGVGGRDFTRKPLLEKLADYNQEKMILAQIESPAGIAELDGMLETKEVSAAIVGPCDLSVAMGIPLQYEDSRFKAAIREVIRICDKHRVSCGMNMSGREHIQYWCGQGMNVIWSGSDVGFFTSGYNQWCSMMESIE